MDYAELSNVFNINPFYVPPKEPEPESIQDQVMDAPVPQKIEITCGDYESHINRCHHCMYSQAKKRSNLINLIIIFALFWLIFRKP